MSTLDKSERDKERDKVVPSCSRKNTIADMVLEILHQDREHQLSHDELRFRIKRTYDRQVIKDSLRRICGRLAIDGKVTKIKKGHFTFYQAKLSQDEHLEMILEKTMQPDLESPKYHKVTLLFKIRQRDKSKGSLPVYSKTLKNAMMFMALRWKEIIPNWSKRKDLKGGIQETIEHNGYKSDYQIFYNGSFQIFTQATHDPFDFVSWFHHYEYQKGIFHSRCGYNLDDFQDQIEIRYEMNVDTPTGRTISNDSSGKFALTLRQFKTMARVYIKQIGEDEIIRREVGNEEDYPLTDFIRENVAILHGGQGDQGKTRMLYEISQRQETIEKTLIPIVNAVKFLMTERNKAKRPRVKNPKKTTTSKGRFCP